MMKKSIFAVAVASALTFGAAQAETIIYGSIRYDYENVKYGDADRVSNLSDAGSRFGIKGSEDLGNNNAAIFNLEWGFNGMSNDIPEKNAQAAYIRKAVLGLTGNWGTFVAGRLDNPFYQTLVDDSVVDGFNGSNVITAATQRAMYSNITRSSAKWGGGKASGLARVGKAAAYVTPDFSGFSASLALIVDGDWKESKDVDMWTLNAQYTHDFGANGELLLKAGYIDGKAAVVDKQGVNVTGNNNEKSKMWGLFAGYSQDAFAVTAAYAQGDHKNPGNDKDKAKGWDLGASFSFGPNYFSTIRAAYGQNELKTGDDKDKVKSWAIGFEQKLSTRTRAWVEYGQTEEKFSTRADNDKVKDKVLSIGMRHDF